MANCYRHWKALNRKNWINWYRRPKCAGFEIIFPVLIMFLMWRMKQLPE